MSRVFSEEFRNDSEAIQIRGSRSQGDYGPFTLSQFRGRLSETPTDEEMGYGTHP